MIWEIYQQHRIGEAERTAKQAAETAKRKSSNTERDLDRLQRHVDRISLACQAMWELVRQQQGLTDEQLDARMLEVDLRDGNADGKIGTQVLNCKSCGRPTNSRRRDCVICGARIEDKPHAFG